MSGCLEAVGITVPLGRRTVLHAVSISVRPGTVTVIAGPNGAGKSTLLAALAGDVRPDSGQVRLDGVGLDRWTAAALASRRAVLPQASRLAFPYTVHEVVRLGLRGVRADAAGLARIERALAAVDLDGFAGRFVQALSGGEQQRVHLARVLCQAWQPSGDASPRYLLLDEPTAGLDLRHQLVAIAAARDFAAAGGGVLAVLHDLNLASLAADRIVMLGDGRVVADGPPAAVLTADIIHRVFGVRAGVRSAAGSARPYILPPGLLDP